MNEGALVMNEGTRRAAGFVGYEYKEVIVGRDLAAIYADHYGNFGWELEGTSLTLAGPMSVSMKFKRDRKIRGKAEITRLQRQFDSLAKEIMSMEQAKSIGAATIAYGIGIVGTAFMAGSVFAYLADRLPLCVILAVPAFVGWILPYFSYLRVKGNKTAQLDPIIEQKYDEMYAVCEKSNALLMP